jgi:hypothetical protein
MAVPSRPNLRFNVYTDILNKSHVYDVSAPHTVLVESVQIDKSSVIDYYEKLTF